jgi:glycosyltransferase involved in cell wall biosynthesis
MREPLHIGIISVLFDRKPEGICTGRFIRALLSSGHRVTLWTSSKADLAFQHENFQVFSVPSGVRSPRWLFNLAARWSGDIPNNFFLWSREIARLLPGKDKPDLIYARSWPHASLVAGYNLAQQIDTPLLLHFSDPFHQDGKEGASFTRDLQKIVDFSCGVTFTNRQSLQFQKKYLNIKDDKGFVLNHVATPSRFFGKPSNPQRFVHIGTVSRHRPADPLLAGFALYNKKYPQSRLCFIGNVQGYLQPLVEKMGLSGCVDILPFTKEVDRVMFEAGVLVCLDAKMDEPLFTPTKIIEYLLCDRPILAVTPAGSPVAELLERSPLTTVAVTTYSPENISSGFSQAAEISYVEDNFRHRFASMDDFSANSVCKDFMGICRKVLIR